VIRAVLFDCAETLIQVTWTPGKVATQALLRLGIDRPDLEESYDRAFYRAIPEYRAANLESEHATAEFWRSLGAGWLNQERLTAPLDDWMAIADDLVFSANSEFFRPFSDSKECLETLHARGIRLAIVSNWDRSLHRILKVHGLSDHFEVVVASLEIGIEKPDTRIFEAALKSLDLDPSQVVHIGDDPIADVIGARSAGIRPYLLDRSRTDGFNSLNLLPEMLDI
jgi:REG-2-like HAD superfamily hydrolase